MLKDVLLAHRLYKSQEIHLAAFVIRDLPETKELGLDNLAWAVYNDSCPTAGDIKPMLKELLNYHGLSWEQAESNYKGE
jgi:hypothetical protein